MTGALGERMTARLGARITFGLAVFAVLALAITGKPTKRLNDFDQSFYLTIAYDLDRHGVFSNGIFDDVDSTKAAPLPGMFFAPLYPALVLAATKIDARFARAVECSVDINHNKDQARDCDIYALPIHIMHAAFLSLGVLAVALSAELIFGGALVFFATGALATAGLLPEADLFSYIMTESVTFGLYSLAALFLVLGWTTSRTRYLFLSGLVLGLVTLARPSFLLLAPVMLGLLALRPIFLPAGRPGTVVAGVLAFAAAFVIVVGPWMARNSLSVGKLGLTEEYGAAVLVERFAFNDMTARELALAFPYCLPAVGPAMVNRTAGADAVARFEWDRPGSFFETGRGRRVALVEQHGKLDPIFGDLFRAEMGDNGWRHLMSSVPLGWCGLWVGQIWSLFGIPLFAWACIEAVRRRKPLFLLYAVPPLLMVGVHALLANHYSRYNLILIGPAAAGSAWVVVQGMTAALARRQAAQRA
jgi:hypothetical protein